MPPRLRHDGRTPPYLALSYFCGNSGCDFPMRDLRHRYVCLLSANGPEQGNHNRSCHLKTLWTDCISDLQNRKNVVR